MNTEITSERGVRYRLAAINAKLKPTGFELVLEIDPANDALTDAWVAWTDCESAGDELPT